MLRRHAWPSGTDTVHGAAIGSKLTSFHCIKRHRPEQEALARAQCSHTIVTLLLGSFPGGEAMFGTRRSTIKGGADASFLSVVKAAAVKADVAVPTITAAANGECMRDRHGQRLHHDGNDDDGDGDAAPIAQHRWFQASAKAVRMSVLEHLERDKARSQVSEQLRVWAADKVQRYSQACLPPCCKLLSAATICNSYTVIDQPRPQALLLLSL